MPNFLELYDELTYETEPAKIYHLWSALSVANNILGKKVWFPMGHFNIYPNLYLLSVGDAGNRKTTALSIADKLFSQTKISQVADTSSTSEAIIDTMASKEARVDFVYNGKQRGYQQYSPYCSEFATFLGGKHINESLIRFMTDIFDPRDVYKYKTKNRGESEIINPFFSFCGACTMDWFLDNLKEGMLTSGFARRIIFIYAGDIYKENALPESNPRMVEILESLLQECFRISKLVGPFHMEEEAKDLHRTSYHETMEKAREETGFLSSYFSTKSVLVLKVCLGISASLGNSMTITRQIYQFALDAFSEVEANYGALFQGTGRNELKKYQTKIIARIAKEPEGILADQLCYLFYNDMLQSDFKECVQVLINAKIVTPTPEGNDVRLIVQSEDKKSSSLYLLRDIAKLRVEADPQVNVGVEVYPVPEQPKVKKPFKLRLGGVPVED